LTYTREIGKFEVIKQGW